jgi:hypothetical protein
LDNAANFEAGPDYFPAVCSSIQVCQSSSPCPV